MQVNWVCDIVFAVANRMLSQIIFMGKINKTLNEIEIDTTN